MWSDAVMFLVEFLAALCAVALCGPCFLACAKRVIFGNEMIRRGHGTHEVEVLGCDEPACPYYKKNARYLMVPAAKRRIYTSPTRSRC